MEQPERSAFSSVAGKAVRATFDGGRLTSDARRAAASRAAAPAAALTASVRGCGRRGVAGRSSVDGPHGRALPVRYATTSRSRHGRQPERSAGAARLARHCEPSTFPPQRRPAALPAMAAP